MMNLLFHLVFVMNLLFHLFSKIVFHKLEYILEKLRILNKSYLMLNLAPATTFEGGRDRNIANFVPGSFSCF